MENISVAVPSVDINRENMDIHPNLSREWMSSPRNDTSGDLVMENLYPALLQCFAVIICGYFAGRMNIISQTEAKGLNTFVGCFSLPALIFLSLVELDLSSVNWMFLVGILIAKSVVFTVVAAVTILVSRPVNPGRAGLFSIFCTQSNDFAVGYPIVVALYRTSHPDYASYLYLMAPISLVILNPIGFILMEIGKRNETNVEIAVKKNKLSIVGSVAKGIVLNPVVFMTALGMVSNVVFNHHLPTWFAQILQVLGSAFSATALFLLGLRMVGKVHTLQGAALLVPGILIAVKLLALPLIIREVVSLFHPGENATDDIDLSTFGFLYGTFPAAPGVFVFALQYSLDIDLIASTMVACTFLSAPLMCISAKMVTINKLNPSDYLHELDSFAFDVSIAGIVACVWLLILFVCSKKYRKIPHRVTCCLVISQLLSCIGIVLWSLLDRSTAISMYLQFALYTIGVYSSRLWTAFLAISLLFLQCRSLCFVLKLQPVFIVLGWGIPLILVTLLMLLVDIDSISKEKLNPNFQYGDAQAAISACLLVLCFLVTIGSLVIHQRYRRRYTRYLLLVQDASSNSDADMSNTETSDLCLSGGCGSQACKNIVNVVDIEDLASSPAHSSHSARNTNGSVVPSSTDTCPANFGCDSSTRVECHSLTTQYHKVDDCDSEEEKDKQILRHTVLLILLVCSMFVGIALSVWTLVLEELSGIYVELAFLDACLNFGQSLIVFAVFGLDTKSIALPLVKRWRKWWYGGAPIILPDWNDLDFETRHVCEQFITHHMSKCSKDISKNKRCRLHYYKKVFKGLELVDWLLGVGLARDRTEAIQYARHLLDGRVIRHVNDMHHFFDSSLLYTFESGSV